MSLDSAAGCDWPAVLPPFLQPLEFWLGGISVQLAHWLIKAVLGNHWPQSWSSWQPASLLHPLGTSELSHEYDLDSAFLCPALSLPCPPVAGPFSVLHWLSPASSSREKFFRNKGSFLLHFAVSHWSPHVPPRPKRLCPSPSKTRFAQALEWATQQTVLTFSSLDYKEKENKTNAIYRFKRWI